MYYRRVKYNIVWWWTTWWFWKATCVSKDTCSLTLTFWTTSLHFFSRADHQHQSPWALWRHFGKRSAHVRGPVSKNSPNPHADVGGTGRRNRLSAFTFGANCAKEMSPIVDPNSTGLKILERTEAGRRAGGPVGRTSCTHAPGKNVARDGTACGNSSPKTSTRTLQYSPPDFGANSGGSNFTYLFLYLDQALRRKSHLGWTQTNNKFCAFPFARRSTHVVYPSNRLLNLSHLS